MASVDDDVFATDTPDDGSGGSDEGEDDDFEVEAPAPANNGHLLMPTQNPTPTVRVSYFFNRDIFNHNSSSPDPRLTSLKPIFLTSLKPPPRWSKLSLLVSHSLKLAAQRDQRASKTTQLGGGRC
jgi:hypothetical protein